MRCLPAPRRAAAPDGPRSWKIVVSPMLQNEAAASRKQLRFAQECEISPHTRVDPHKADRRKRSPPARRPPPAARAPPSRPCEGLPRCPQMSCGWQRCVAIAMPRDAKFREISAAAGRMIFDENRSHARRGSAPRCPPRLIPQRDRRKSTLRSPAPRILKRVSRRRSLEGRRAVPRRVCSRRLRYLPAITRMARASLSSRTRRRT